ncbi:MAG: tRNA-dihydrouridine synthase family protein [Bdellovibrionales bacterium]
MLSHSTTSLNIPLKTRSWEAFLHSVKRPILNGRVDFPLCLAPMVGLSHVHFRTIVRSYLPEGAYTIWPTEMLNSRRLPSENFALTPETRKNLDEVGLVPQILGNEETPIRESVAKLVEWGAEGIDINMGCPVKKALKHNYGVALMGDIEYASEVVRMTVRHSQVPVSVKLRSGLYGDQEFLLKFIKALEAAGASWITLHPRMAVQKRKGEAQWEQVGWIRDRVGIPIIGNGDVQIAEDALEMWQETQCDAVMVGRAMTARPWLFWQVGERMGLSAPSGRLGLAPRNSLEEGAEYGRMLLQMASLFAGEENQDLALRQFRFFVRTGSPWLQFGHTLMAGMMKSKNFAEIESFLLQFFAAPQMMAERTDLRS